MEKAKPKLTVAALVSDLREMAEVGYVQLAPGNIVGPKPAEAPITPEDSPIPPVTQNGH
jgi:hypothetical protein